MRKFFIAVVAALLLPVIGWSQEPSLQKPVDPPKPTLRHRVFDKKFLAVIGIDVGVSVATTLKLNKCRLDHGLGPCVDGGYGPYDTRETVRQVQTGSLDLLAFFMKRDEDRSNAKYKFWWVFPAFNTAWNASGMIRNQFHAFPPKSEDRLLELK